MPLPRLHFPVTAYGLSKAYTPVWLRVNSRLVGGSAGRRDIATPADRSDGQRGEYDALLLAAVRD